MNKLSKNQKRLIVLILVLLALVGCKRPEGNDPTEFYSLSTTFMEVFKVSKFNALFVYPITLVINYVIEVLNWGIIAGIGIATTVVNLITMPLMLYSQTNSTKMQLIQPQINKIEKKYEGRTDQNSVMMKTAELQKLYKDNDIKLGMTLIGSFLPLPLLIAMLQAVYRATALYDQNNLVFGSNLNLRPFDGFKQGPNGWMYILIIGLMVAMQFVSMKLPQYMAKARLKKDRSYKSYDKNQKAENPMDNMLNSMMILMVFVAVSTPTTMSVYYIFSSLMAIVRAIVSDMVIQKNTDKGGRK